MDEISFFCLFDCFEAMFVQQTCTIYENSRKKTFNNSQFSHLVWFMIKGEKKKKNHHISLYFPQIDLIKTYFRNAAKNSGNKHKVYSA